MIRRGLGVVALLGMGACTVGSGSGQAAGSIFALDCDENGDYGSPSSPQPYVLDPSFLAGEPIEDIRRSTSRPLNRLVIRAQKSGARVERNDNLYVDVSNSYEVARCVRGRTEGGVPDYDPAVCSWATGVPRMRVGRKDVVRAWFSPFLTCSQTFRTYANLIGVAVYEPFDPMVAGGGHPTTPGSAPPPPESWMSWIEFTHFGGAEQFDVPPDRRGAISRGFKVEFGARVHASAFRFVLDDERVWTASERFDPIPAPAIGGVLEGFIDFEAERGRAAQTFP